MLSYKSRNILHQNSEMQYVNMIINALLLALYKSSGATLEKFEIFCLNCFEIYLIFMLIQKRNITPGILEKLGRVVSNSMVSGLHYLTYFSLFCGIKWIIISVS